MECQPQLIERLMLPVNVEPLREHCEQSLSRVCAEYNVATSLAVICELRQSIVQMSFTNCLALFFLLLNIDTDLKHGLMQSEVRSQQGRCANFFQNLRIYMIAEFLSTDASDTDVCHSMPRRVECVITHRQIATLTHDAHYHVV